MDITRLLNPIYKKLKDYVKIVFIVVFLLFILSLTRSVLTTKKAGEKIIETQKEVNELEIQKRELERKVIAAESEFYVEQQLRNNLGLAKEGEAVMVLPEDDVLRKLAPKLHREKDELPDPTWKKWLKLFI
ncbi:septum formation initiator family protein [Candidatus Woesebacteria bacterium]|nr:MAG: septum formation initiator family protein [Candidatus Woesebacteria bacterium]